MKSEKLLKRLKQIRKIAHKKGWLALEREITEVENGFRKSTLLKDIELISRIHYEKMVEKYDNNQIDSLNAFMASNYIGEKPDAGETLTP